MREEVIEKENYQYNPDKMTTFRENGPSVKNWSQGEKCGANFWRKKTVERICERETDGEGRVRCKERWRRWRKREMVNEKERVCLRKSPKSLCGGKHFCSNFLKKRKLAFDAMTLIFDFWLLGENFFPLN